MHPVDPASADPYRPKSSRHGERTSSKHGERAPSRATSRHSEKLPPSRRGERPSSKARPSTSAPSTRRDRPSSSSKSRPSSSSREHTSRHLDDSTRRAKFDVILEDVQYPEDSMILRSSSQLFALIEQHSENFYFPGEHDPCNPDSNPSIRYAIIRQGIAKGIIEKVVMSRREMPDAELRDLASRLSAEFEEYSYHNNESQRQNHLCELCSLGAQLREHMLAHPSKWEFAPFDEAKSRYIMVFPTLFKDDEQAAARRIFKI
ncbi:hypothetical protein BGZ60DRAFT_227686 [Tricladium varicosporioides]|nr:hypothetical protein BGZ60DRAFT_227686 [Hymenoscyphus varicosporioides]